MTLTGKNVAIMLDQQYQELEVWYPCYRLIEEGAKVTFVAPEAGVTYPSKLGYPCVSDAAAREVKGGDFDAVIVPGGWCPDFMRRGESMIHFIEQCAEAGANVFVAGSEVYSAPDAAAEIDRLRALAEAARRR